MPKIPLYNQGQGTATGLAAGQLSQRASSAAFEAPGKAMAGLGETISNIATQFGMAEKRAQADEAKNEAISTYVPQAQQLIDNPKSNTVRGFDIEAGSFKANAIAEIDSRTDLTRSQKAFVRDNVNRAIDSKLALGRAKVFTQQQDSRKKQAQAALSVYIDEAVSNKALRPEIMSDINNLILDANNNGLNVGWTIDSVGFEIDKREILSETTDQTKDISYFTEENKRVLNGEGRGKGRSAAERQSLSRMYESHINYLKGPLLADANAKSKNAVASITLTGEGAEDAAEAASMYRQAGRPDLAMDIELQSEVAISTFNTVDALTFSSTQDVLDKRDMLMSEATAASGTDQAAKKLMQVEMFDKAIEERKTKLDNDPVSYIVENFKRKFPYIGDPTKGPSLDQILVAQKEMGVPDGELKIFTNGQVKAFNKTISQAQTSEDVDAALIEFGVKSEAGLPVSKEITAAGMRQLRANGLSLAMNYVANSPESPMSDVLLQSALPGAIQISVTPTNKDMLNAQIRNNDAVRTHLNSMLGGSFVDFQGNTIRAAAADTTGMRDARQQHIDMISNLTVYLIQRDGQSLSGDQRVDVNGVQSYIDKAATIFEERYSYINKFPNQNVSLRLPKSMAGSTEFIKKRLELAVSNLNEENVYFRPQRDGEVEAEYKTSRKVYLNEVKGGYGWVVSSDGSEAILLDKNAGAVINTEGQPIKLLLSDVIKEQRTQMEGIKKGKAAAKIPLSPITAFDVETIGQ